MLDRAVKSAVTDHDFYRLALNGLSNHHAGPSEANGALPYTQRGRAQVRNGRPPARGPDWQRSRIDATAVG
jgi:hypothetical protein